MKISVVVAVESVNDYVRENIKHLLAMDFQDFEILLFLAQPSAEAFAKTRIIVRPDLAFNPAQRRDLATQEAQGEFLAFIDDDAYPSKSWLSNALLHFDDPKVAAVGGPGVTPVEDDWRRQVSGWVSASPLGGGAYRYRFLPEREREVDDYPSMNLIIRKKDFSLVGGFDSHYFPGEDTKLCLDLTQKLGKKIIYDPAVLVYHHRRPIFRAHLAQIGHYGLHRGFFAKDLPRTSRRVSYFLPTLFALSLTTGLTALAISKLTHFRLPTQGYWSFFSLYLLLLTSYFLLLLFNGLWVWRKSGSLKIAFWTVPTIFLTHFWYGLQFLRGLFSKNLER